MSMVIGGVTLAHDMIVTGGLGHDTSVDTNIQYTVGGYPVVSVKRKTHMPVYVFTATDSSGWLTKQNVTDLETLRRTSESFTVTLNGSSFTGCFIGEFSMDPLMNYNDSYFTGTFSILKIS